MQQLKYLVPVWNKTPTHKSQLLMKQNSESFHFELKCFIWILTSPFLISCYVMSPFSSKVLKCLILKRVKIMLLAFGNVFIKDNVLLWRTLLSTSWHFMAELSIKVVPTSFVTEIFLGTRSQPSLQLIPRLLDAGIPDWFRELRSQHAFLRHIFSSVSLGIIWILTFPCHILLCPWLSLLKCLTSVKNTSLPHPNRYHLIFHHWLKPVRFLKMAFVVGSFGYVLWDLTKWTVLAAASTRSRIQR